MKRHSHIVGLLVIGLLLWFWWKQRGISANPAFASGPTANPISQQLASNHPSPSLPSSSDVRFPTDGIFADKVCAVSANPWGGRSSVIAGPGACTAYQNAQEGIVPTPDQLWPFTPGNDNPGSGGGAAPVFGDLGGGYR